jgi:Prolyl oligopeptidase family
VLFEGPGQQSMLFERDIPFRHDWEEVLTQVVDFVLARDDVDADRLCLYGVSQAGYWVPRALAFEHRFAAAIADGGVVDVLRSWLQNLPHPLRKAHEKGEKEKFDEEMALGMRLPGRQHGLPSRSARGPTGCPGTRPCSMPSPGKLTEQRMFDWMDEQIR